MRLAAGLSVVAVALLVAGCGGEGVQPIEVEGNEYAFVMPDEAEGGVVRFNVSNTGKELHEYALGRLDAGKTLDDVKKALASEQEDPPEWFVDVGGVPLLSPGEELVLTRELQAGTYVLLCFIPSPRGVPHVELGMLKSFELTGDSGAALPEPDAVIVANDAGYEVPELSAGEQTIELRNADNREREFFLIALKPGTEIEDLRSLLRRGRQGSPSGPVLRGDADDPRRHLGLHRHRSGRGRRVHLERRVRRRAGRRHVHPRVAHCEAVRQRRAHRCAGDRRARGRPQAGSGGPRVRATPRRTPPLPPRFPSVPRRTASQRP